MCRLLAVKSNNEFSIPVYLENFALISKNSKEYQGHGWGIAYLDSSDNWQLYKNISPIWEDDFSKFGKSKLILAHARSAFEDKDIVIENNMPFIQDGKVFIFNGELRGVKIKEQGKIGAEKIMNYIYRFEKSGLEPALNKAVNIIHKRTRDIKGMNIIICDKEKIYLSSLFNREVEYYTIHYKESNELIICSAPFEEGWNKISNRTIKVFE